MKKIFALFVLTVLMCSLGNRALAQNRAIMKPVTETIDFTGLPAPDGINQTPNASINWSNNGNGTTIQSISYDNGTRTFSEHPISVGNRNYDWHLWKGSHSITYLQKGNANSDYFYIENLKDGDVVTMWGDNGQRANNQNGGFIVASNNNDRYDSSNPILSLEYDLGNPGQVITMTSNGTLQLQFTGQYSGVERITIQSTVRAEDYFNYDPGYEEYDMYDEFSANDPKRNGDKHTSYNTNSPDETGFSLNGNTAKYIVLEGSKITANNRIAIYPYDNWRFNFGLRAPNNGQWANFSICNLKEGDRVVFSYTGTAPVFSSVAGGTTAPTGPYNGCKAFADHYNDGIYDEGEDHFIESGTTPSIDWNRPEYYIREQDTGSLDLNNGYPLNYTQAYVVTEDGHMDLAIAPDTRIVKIKIYSDHQATMVDDYNSRNYTYTSHFDITGELQAMEHIVPGGLEVHVGNNDASQHAHVVYSPKGPVSIVNGVKGFKLPGMTLDENGNLQFQFHLESNIPETGTFYKFMPLEDGKMTLTFQATSMNYYSYALNGDEVYYGDNSSFGDDNWSVINDRPNEQTVDVNCPYYLVTIKEDGTTTFRKIGEYRNGAYPPALKIDDAEAGDTYYLYGGWNASNLQFNGSGQRQNNLEYLPFGNGNGGKNNACGVAKLLEVKFEPVRKIYPLAKWVPNGTTGVYEDSPQDRNGVPNPDNPSYDPAKLEYDLAYVEGYNNATITIKKMTGNIESCNAYIKPGPGNNNGRLMIKNITYKNGMDKGGTILIKIGNPDIKSDPVYTLTIAYSADTQFDGKTGTGPRGHSWDFSSNSLHGLEWETNNYAPNGAAPADYGHYFANYFTADISDCSSKDDVLEKLKNQLSGSGQLYDEIHAEEMHSGTSDWMFNYNLQFGGNLYDPLFSNKFDLEGDNADLIWETEGTVLKTSANQSCMFNEFTGTDIHQSEADPERYVGILKGGEFRIPWLMANDRVIIYMGTGKGGNNPDEAKFSIKNAYDAVHNEISPDDDYIVGGSQWNYYTYKDENDQDVVNDDRNYRGCYHFFATGDKNNEGKPADMVFKMTGGSMCKIYSIQIYRGDRIVTNEVIGATDNDKFLLWSRDNDPNDGTGKDIGPTYNWTLKYFGKDQKLADGTNGVKNDFAAKTGCINFDLATSTETDPTQPTYNTFTYPNDYGQIGTFRARGKDMEKNMKYVADYGEHNVTVAYQQTMKYPYTWDFMDMTGWGNNSSNFHSEDAYGSSSSPTYTWPEWFDSEDLWNASYENSSTDLSLWDEDAENDTYYLRLNSQSGQEYPDNMKEKDNIFETAREIDGNQVWANGSIVPETQGLWFHSLDNNRNSNTWGVTNSGMAFNGTSKNILKVVVPNVPTGAAVYLRMVTNRPDFDHAFEFKGGNTDYSVYGPTKVEGTSSEYILAIKNDGAKRHLTLSLAGYQLRKLAVSEDPKTVNKKGYASESHKRVIDHSLTSFFTGKNIKAYTAQNYNESASTISLVEVTKPMPAATADGQTVGSVLYNNDYYKDEDGNEYGQVAILDGGFHLFVPDMHDYSGNPNDIEHMITNELENTSSNWMKSYNAGAKSNATIAQKGDDGVRYVLSYQYFEHDKDNQALNEAAQEAFYRVAKNGAQIKPNSAYISFPTTSQAKVSFAFGDFIEEYGIATPIEEVLNEGTDNDNDVYYTMSGTRISRPTQSGLYIKNGKKVYVK